MKNPRLMIAVFALTLAGCLQAQPPVNEAGMDAYVSDLMSRMTLEEKIGQLNLLSVGFDVTGPQLSQDADAKIRQGLVGGVFNTYTPVAVRKLQYAGLKESRLGHPAAVWLRCHSRSQDDFSHPARTLLHLESWIRLSAARALPRPKPAPMA